MLTKEQRDKVEINGLLYLCYDYLLAIAEDRILATHGGSISLIDNKGTMLCTYDSIYVPMYPVGSHFDQSENLEVAEYNFVDDVLVYIDNGKSGLIDYDGNIIIEAQYSTIEFDGIDAMCVIP